ncbi:hypothetical protein F2A37_16700 [Pseudomonas chlororaphis]|uniref:hypothetical protein n=1 Tax=Pseudomonas chlororaphis TaxID=587753 RepID=UPI001231FF8A|nr:hypothetical protein [Pseudomonas chlororaphis]KAA5842304.1 hypothetical protein F2A37_16700 [Pseudomonas chlororaphis]
MPKEIDWSNAPEGATHWGPAVDHLSANWFCWHLDMWSIWRGGKWNLMNSGVQLLRINTLVPRPKPWNGEGLPPVGTVCLVVPHNTLWGFSSTAEHEREILAYHTDYVWLGHEGIALEATRTDKADFLPIRTPEQIAAEERRNAIDALADELAGYQGCEAKDRHQNLALYLHDQGYRKQVAP